MHHGLRGLRDDHLGHEVAVAHPVVTFETQEAGGAFASQVPGLHKLCLRAVGCHVGAKDALHAVGVTGAGRVASGLGSSQRLKVNIGNASLIQRSGQLAFGEAGFS